MPTRVYDLDGEGRTVDEREPEEVFIAAVLDAARRERVFVVAEPGHADFNEKVRAAGFDLLEDSLVTHGALILCGTVDEWPEIREELRGLSEHQAWQNTIEGGAAGDGPGGADG